MVFATLGGLLQKLDIFGHKVGVHYRGEDTYKTKLGGLLSLATYVLVLIQTINLVTDFVNHTAQTENFVRIKQDLIDQGEFNLNDLQFQLLIVDTVKGIYPESIGKWVVRKLQILDWGRGYESQDMNLVQCGTYDQEVVDFWSKR